MPQLTMPNVGEGVTEGTVTRWLKREGDAVALDEPVVEVETDKAVVEIPSPYEGVLATIIVQEGETVPIGAPLADVVPVGARHASPSPAGVTAPPAAPNHLPSPAAPAASPSPPNRLLPTNGANATRQFPRTRRYSPVVMKLASEHQIDVALVRGTGIEGRVTRQDVLRYIENPVLHAAPPPVSAGVVGVPERPNVGADSRVRPPRSQDEPPVDGAPAASDVIPLTPTRRAIAAHLSEQHRSVPVAWMVVEADVTGLVTLRDHMKAEFERVEGVKLSYLPFFVQAIVAALRKHPDLNATFTGGGVTRHRRYDIGIAVAAASGLVVPVVRNAGDLSLAGLAKAIDDLATRAHARKLRIEEMRDATFTVDSTGAFGSIISQPIVPAGQVAIITTEAIRREVRPRDDGAIAVRSVMNLCISFDHRALDGAEAGRFMQSVRAGLEALTR